MFNLTRKGLWAHKVRFLLTGLAVVLGVAFMAGTMILTDTMGKTFDGLFATSNEGIDVVVHRTTGVDSTGGIDVQERVDASARRQHHEPSTASTPPPARSRASPSSSSPTARRSTPATASAARSARAGSTTSGSTRSRLSAGRAPEGADRGRPRPGHRGRPRAGRSATRVGVLAKDATTEMTIVGTATFGDVEGIPGFTVVAADDATAQALFAQPGSLRRHRRGLATARTTNDELATAIAGGGRVRRPRDPHRRGRHRRQAGRRSRRT